MRIENHNRTILPNPYTASTVTELPKLETGSAPQIQEHYYVELSSVAARELPEGVIEHEPVKRYFNEEVNTSLEKVLADKAPEVSKAVYQLIESNFFASDADYREEERASLIAAGITQAQFIADNYMRPDEAAEFMDKIRLIAAVAKTRQVDPRTGHVSYVELPQRPHGAPEDYVRTEDLMRRYDPEAYAKLGKAIANGENFASILIQFAAKLQSHPEWIQAYRREQAQIMSNLRNTRIDNEFEHIKATTVQDFVAVMQSHIEQSSVDYKDLLLRNTMAFARILGF